MLHRFAQLVVAGTVFLILAGSLVTSTGSGLAVPDWPTTYGWNMFTFPPSKWVGGIFYEHGHRLIASTIGFLTIVLAAWIWRADSRSWMKRLGFAALAAVIVQGLLGGITVLYFLPPAVSTTHAGLAQIFFCLVVAIAAFTSPRWLGGHETVVDLKLRQVATATTVLIYIQIIVGAAMRHSGAGLAIPDFPLMFGGLIPDRWSPAIAVHFAHRVGALVVTTAIVATTAHIWYHHRGRTVLTRPALALSLLLVIQVTLGALTILTARNVWINSAHVVGGAAVLGTSLALTLRTWRSSFAGAVLVSSEKVRGARRLTPRDARGAAREVEA